MNISEEPKTTEELLCEEVIRKDMEIEYLKTEVLLSKGICQSRAEARRIIRQDAYDYVINKKDKLEKME